jgi:hypothetical protein
MASSLLQIHDQHFGERTTKILKSVIWDAFLQYLRTGIVSVELSTLVKNKGLPPLPKLPKLPIDSGLVAIPTPTGLTIYLPDEKDFFYRERDANNKIVQSKKQGQIPGFGIAMKANMDKNGCSQTIGWQLIINHIVIISEHIFSEYAFFENNSPQDILSTGMSTDYFKCEIPTLNHLSKFFIACCFITQNYERVTPIIYSYAMTESTVISLMVRRVEIPDDMNMYRNQMKALNSGLCEIVNPKVDDIGGMISFVSYLGIKIETRNRCGLRLPNISGGKYSIMDLSSTFGCLTFHGKSYSSASTSSSAESPKSQIISPIPASSPEQLFKNKENELSDDDDNFSTEVAALSQTHGKSKK